MLQPTITVDQRQLNAYLKRLDRNRGKPLRDRAQRTTNSAAKLLVPKLRAAAPKGPNKRRSSGPLKMVGKRRKTLRSSAKAKMLRQRGGEVIRPTWVGYTSFVWHFLEGGTRMHYLQTRHLEVGARGRWTTPGSSNFGTSNWRSGFAHFADGEVRPLANIDVRGITPIDLVGQVWNSEKRGIYDRIAKDVFEVR